MAAEERRTLSREDLFNRRRMKEFVIPDSDGMAGGVVYVQSLPFAIADRILEESGVGEEGEEEEEAKIDVAAFLEDFLIHGVVDEDGERIFLEEDRDRLRPELPFDLAFDLAMEVMEVTGMADMAEEEDAEGNSEGGED